MPNTLGESPDSPARSDRRSGKELPSRDDIAEAIQLAFLRDVDRVGPLKDSTNPESWLPEADAVLALLRDESE